MRVALALERGVSQSKPGTKVFGQSALMVDGKIFAMLSLAEHFVVKLPKNRVDELTASKAGTRFEASPGHPLKEWLQVSSQSDLDWLVWAHEALAFVRGTP